MCSSDLVFREIQSTRSESLRFFVWAPIAPPLVRFVFRCCSNPPRSSEPFSIFLSVCKTLSDRFGSAAYSSRFPIPCVEYRSRRHRRLDGFRPCFTARKAAYLFDGQANKLHRSALLDQDPRQGNQSNLLPSAAASFM